MSTLVQFNNFVKLEDELLPEFPSRNPSRRGFGDFKRNAGTFGGENDMSLATGCSMVRSHKGEELATCLDALKDKNGKSFESNR